MASLSADALSSFDRVSLYNSPFPAHDEGRAIDCYARSHAPSPVAGTVVETRATRAPSRPHAAAADHLVVVDTGDHLARLLHVRPTVAPGDAVAVGDPLGPLVPSGYLAPWVGTHVHVGFRPSDGDPVRASGSLPLELDVPVRAAPWDGVGRVVERAPTYVDLAGPPHPAPGTLAGVASDGGAALDGGFPHYDGGGAFGGGAGAVSLFGARVGERSGRTVRWDEAVTVRANGTPVTGLSLSLSRTGPLRVRVVCPGDWTAPVGETVRLSVG
ncbi:MAG: hypothetical protein ABEJ70_05050 [Halobacteriaceae archaeon]